MGYDPGMLREGDRCIVIKASHPHAGDIFTVKEIFTIPAYKRFRKRYIIIGYFDGETEEWWLPPAFIRPHTEHLNPVSVEDLVSILIGG